MHTTGRSQSGERPATQLGFRSLWPVLEIEWCERGDLNPHALRHRILSPARLPFRHSRVNKKVLDSQGFLK